MTEQEKSIYNCFLKHFRNGEPFQPRKDFSNIDEKTKVLINKMSKFFNKFPHINWDDYFGAPRGLHPEEKCPFLDYFLTRSAIRSYTIFMQKKEMDDPKNQLESIEKGFKFIGMFCLRNNITLDKYLEHKDHIMYSWTKHYRERHINPYCLMELGDVLTQISEMPFDEKELYLGNLVENFGRMKIRYHQSNEVKNYVKKATKKVEEFLQRNLKNKI